MSFPSRRRKSDDSLVNVTDELPEVPNQGDASQQVESKALLVSTLHSGERGGRYRLSVKLLLPTAGVFLLTAGMGFVFIAWFQTHKTQPTLSQVFSDRAFLLDEGTTQTETGQEARLMGLTISSAAAYAVGLTTQTLMGLYAFRTAHGWIQQSQSEQTDRHNLPSPLQYGLLVEMLSATGLGSLWNAGRYLTRKPVKRYRAGWLFFEAFVVGLIVYGFIHAVSAVDLWLHSVSRTVIHPVNTATNTPLPLGIKTINCDRLQTGQSEDDCFYEFYGPGPIVTTTNPTSIGISDRTNGMLVSSNSSSTLKTITLADSTDLAVLVNTVVPPNVAFRAKSFGARASCQLETPQCNFANGGTGIGCSGAPQDFPPCVNLGIPAAQSGCQNLNNGDSVAFIVTSNADGGQFFTPQTLTQAEVLGSALGGDDSYKVWLQFLWKGQEVKPGHSAVMLFNFTSTMIASCSIQFRDVTLDYSSDGTYKLVSEQALSADLSNLMSMPMRSGFFTNNLLVNIQGIAFQSTNADIPIAFLRQDLARLALGTPAFMIATGDPTIQQFTSGNLILGRYPTAPVVCLLLLLFGNSALALAICIATAFSRADKIQVPRELDEGAKEKKSKKKATDEIKSVSALELAQVRLTRPVALIAEIFPVVDQNGNRRAGFSAKKSASDMFDETGTEERVEVGLYRVEEEEKKDVFVYGVHRP